MATSTPLVAAHLKAALPSLNGFGPGAGQGYVASDRGTSALAGFLGFYLSDGTRIGTIGRSTGTADRLEIGADNGRTLHMRGAVGFEQRPTFVGATPYDTSNLGNATASTAGLMTASHYSRVNGATASATANTLALRSSDGHLFGQNLGANNGGIWLNSAQTKFIDGGGSGIFFSHACTAPSFTPTSDLALKENLTVDLDDEQAVIAICQIARAEWDSTEDGAHRMGVVAQALSDVDPRWVTGGEVVDAPEPDQLSPPVWDEDAEVWRRPLRVDPMAMLSSAFAAIRSLANQNGALESRVAALEAALSSET